MKNKIKLKLHIYRGQNKNSYFFTLGSYGDEFHIRTTGVHQHDYELFIDKLKSDYGLEFPKNFKDNYWGSDEDQDMNQTVIVYKDFTVETKENLTPYTRV